MSKTKRQESPLDADADPGKRIRHWRLKMGLTQAQVEERAGTAHNAISRIERGEVTNPHFDTLERIAAVLGMNLDELQMRPIPAECETEDDGAGELLRRVKDLPQKKRTAIVDALRRLLDAME